MYTLKSTLKRGMTLSAGLGLVVASFASMATPVFADALNPLTDRSLTLSSSSPGWDYTDGSGNSTYAPPNSGANGKKTGNYFTFKVSTDSSPSGTNAPIKAFTFQYCTTSAGNCLAPGDNGFTGSAPSATRNADSTTKTDLNITSASPTEIGTSDFGTIVNTSTGDILTTPQADIVQVANPPAANNAVTGNYVVYYNNGGTWTQSTGWTLTVGNNETGTVGDATATGKNNFMTLKNTTGQGFTAGQEVKVLFFASDNKFYITNPGSSWFFVKINTYNSDTTQDNSTLVDGGVTVANMMNHSIRIQTKVLETMQFSVGTVDPNTLDSTGGATGGSGTGSELYLANGNATHTVCDPILQGMVPSNPINVLSMGNQDGENSLEVGRTYSTHSYWRLSSNSSAGATVYYSGHTLSNTVGDDIDAIGTSPLAPTPGAEQFGLALTTNGDAGVHTTNYDTESTASYVYEQGADLNKSGVHASLATDVGVNPSYHAPRLAPLIPEATYADGAGFVNANYAGGSNAIDTSFAFDNNSTLVPVALASEDTDVVDCVTGRMRYIANIAATTPAGIYTTAINYIAAPQY